MKDNKHQLIAAIVILLIIIIGIFWFRNRIADNQVEPGTTSQSDTSLDRIFSEVTPSVSTGAPATTTNQPASNTVSRNFSPLTGRDAMATADFVRQQDAVVLTVSANLPETEKTYALWAVGSTGLPTVRLGELSLNKAGYLLETTLQADQNIAKLIISEDESVSVAQPGSAMLELTL